MEIIYTDGSKSKIGKAVGASIIIEDRDIAYKISLPRKCSSYTAEAFAIKAVLELMYNEKDNTAKHIVVMSDSQAVLKAYQNNIFNVYHNRYVTEGKKICYKLKRKLDKNVTLIWIPAHIGIQGNELADKLAKEAVGEDPHDSIEIPIRDLKREFKLETWNMTQESLVKDARIKGKAYFENFYNGKKRKRGFISLITQGI